MTNRTTRREIEIEPGVHVLKPVNHDTAVVVLVVREGRIEVWLKMSGNAEWQ